MPDAKRDLDNLTDWLMRASHGQLSMLSLALARELLMRGLPGDAPLFELAAALRRSKSTPRAEPLARPT